MSTPNTTSNESVTEQNDNPESSIMRHVRIYSRSDSESVYWAEFYIKKGEEDKISCLLKMFEDYADDYLYRVSFSDIEEEDMEWELMKYIDSDLRESVNYAELEEKAMRYHKIHPSDLEDWADNFRSMNGRDPTPLDKVEWFLEGIYYFEELQRGDR